MQQQTGSQDVVQMPVRKENATDVTTKKVEKCRKMIKALSECAMIERAETKMYSSMQEFFEKVNH